MTKPLDLEALIQLENEYDAVLFDHFATNDSQKKTALLRKINHYIQMEGNYHQSKSRMTPTSILSFF